MKIPLRQYWKLLVNYLKPQKGRVIWMAVLLFSSIGLQLLNPQILRHFIDSAISGDQNTNMLGLAGLFLAVAFVTQILGVLATYTSENVGWTATNALRNDLTEHCLRLDMDFHNTHTPGELIERLDGDVTALAKFFSQLVVRVLGNILLLIGVLILLFLEDWRVGLALTGFSIISVFILTRIRGLAVGDSKNFSVANADLFGFFEERVAGLEDIRSNGAEAYTQRRLTEVLRGFFYNGRKANMGYTRIYFIATLMFAAGYVLALSLGAAFFMSGAITLGTVYLIFQYTEMLRMPIEQMTRQVQDLQRASAGILRIQELFNIQPKVQDGTQATLPSGPLSVEFERVQFGYNSEELILKDIGFRLEPGTVLGLLGRTGSGKTTLSRLLFRLYDINQGMLRVGGANIAELRLDDLRQRVGLVTQEVQLFHASVRDNLTFFDATVSDAKILEIIYELGLGDWFRGLPQGLDTELRSGGVGLSAGEAQLLAFTRLFLADPGLVILDEASSRLDPATERLIETAIDKLLQNRTAIIIAHRLATVQRADQIMILQDGQILEYGPRLQLSSDAHSRFSQLLQVGLEETLV